MKPLSIAVMAIGLCIAFTANAQKKLPVIKATKERAVILDGKNFRTNWQLDPKLKPDKYYVIMPRRKSKVIFQTDQGKLSFTTQYGESYDLVVILNEKDSCFNRIVAREAPTGISVQTQKPSPDTIPFTLMGSRIYLSGLLNEKEHVKIQFDLCSGGSCVNKMVAEKLNLLFNKTTILSNNQGINEARSSTKNKLTIGNQTFNDISITEVGNMQTGEDLIIGNYLFPNKIIEIDYDRKLFIIQETLPDYIKTFKKQQAFFEQGIPKFKASIVHNGKKYWFWFGFDTGRDGTMRIGEDFTGQGENWKNLKELTMVNGRKIIRLDATIAGIKFKDIVTNAADPIKKAKIASSTIFGNAVLNHFNVILDNQQGCLYLKPNGRRNEPYFTYKDYEKEIEKLKR